MIFRSIVDGYKIAAHANGFRLSLGPRPRPAQHIVAAVRISQVGIGKSQISSCIGDPGRIADDLVIAQHAGIGIAPGGAGESGGAKESGAVVDANGLTGSQGSGECAAYR